ncbi:141aa long hypothetical protein [Pyrococcus horikoshii OT3]|uniref:Uncharacterized protein n=1 Tax=Pyrococcus horikoshii (strain ATCC 700860 / DSM 12428 / JCM 9974 / NBRC 100139 / OT-3) TaxID=70601 RepID=O59516_PYRHO|nr:141aa long hypothetical protein [Pyrococcus horikoshii OT3]
MALSMTSLNFPSFLSPSRILSTSSFLKSGSIGIPLVWICSISFLPCLSGTPTSISLSKRPGLLKAGSKASGLLVAPITITLPLPFKPSIKASSWATTLFSTSPVTSLLFGAIASISSIKIIDGAFSSASLNTSLNLSSLSP